MWIMASRTMRYSIRPLARRLLPCLCAGLVMVLACDGSTSAEGPFEITLVVSPTPPTTAASAFLIAVVDSLGGTVTGATVMVTAEVAGNPPIVADAREDSPGRYGVSAFEFPVTGKWTLSAQVTTPAGVTGLRSFPISVVPSGH
jgi:hypothetical protein